MAAPARMPHPALRNGHAFERQLQTGLGAVTVKQPRVIDERVDDDGGCFRFTHKTGTVLNKLPKQPVPMNGANSYASPTSLLTLPMPRRLFALR